ncbi:MAG: (2Fe-2S)-binding protein [Steroidobacteraceae bacterium]|nr:(2Fe-2S)-binding protein [Steroidobacteraceae bacterium]
MRLNCIINGAAVSVDIDADARLIDVLRDALALTGTKEGCAEGECGACTVLIDGLAVNSCLVLAAQVEGRSLLTIEGLASGDGANALQRNFIERGAIQCGFCTPGMLMSATALLMRVQQPSREEIRRALAGNLCRCTGYEPIIEAVAAAADEMAGPA